MPSYTLLHRKENIDYANFLLSLSSWHSRLSSNVCLNFISCLIFHVYLPIPSTINHSNLSFLFYVYHLPICQILTLYRGLCQRLDCFDLHTFGQYFATQMSGITSHNCLVHLWDYDSTKLQRLWVLIPQGNKIFTVILTQESSNQTNKNLLSIPIINFYSTPS